MQTLKETVRYMRTESIDVRKVVIWTVWSKISEAEVALVWKKRTKREVQRTTRSPQS